MGCVNSFSERDDVYLKDKWLNSQLSMGAMAKELGRTRSSIAGRIHRLGLKRSHVDRIHSKHDNPLKKQIKTSEKLSPEQPSLDIVAIPSVLIACCGDPVRFIERQPYLRCAWPIWQDDDPVEEKLCCGNRTVTGTEYCQEHTAIGTHIRPSEHVHDPKRNTGKYVWETW